MLQGLRAIVRENPLEIHALACDLSGDSGEGFLANSLIRGIESKFRVVVYRDFVTAKLGSIAFARDRVLPLYLFIVALFLRLGGKKVVLLNYVPLWNFLNGVLVRLGVRLAPITGSALVVPSRAGLLKRFKRLHLQKILIGIFECVVPKRSFLWCATPSVYLELSRAGFTDLCFGFPFLGNITPCWADEREYDIFIYTSRHPIKNHAAALEFLKAAGDHGYKICYIGPDVDAASNITARNRVSEEEFNELLGKSRLFISFSFEDAGITGFKALAYGVPLLCPRRSGLAYALKYDDNFCFDDPFDSRWVWHQANGILSKRAVPREALQHTFEELKNDSQQSLAVWLSKL